MPAPGAAATDNHAAVPSQHAQNVASEMLTSSLMQSAQEIIQRAEAEGRDPEEELRQVVGRHVLQGMAAGYDLREQAQTEDHEREDRGSDDVKRSRTDGGQGPM